MTKTLAVIGIALLLLAALVPVPLLLVCAIVTLLAAPAILIARRRVTFVLGAAQLLALFAVIPFRAPPALV